MKKNAAVVVNSETPNGYGVIVNLGRMGIPVYSVDSNPNTITFISRYAKKVLSPDINDSEDEYLQFLINLGKQLDPKPVLFITGDLMVLALLKHKKTLEQYFYMPMPALAIAETLIDKVQFYSMLDKYHINHANTFIPRNSSEIEQFSHALEYPYIIKPVQSGAFVNLFHNKCLKASSAEELVEFYNLASQTEDILIVQQELQGTERYLVYMYFDQNSNPLAVCCYKKLRIFPIDYGNACACITMWDQEIVDIGLNLLKKIGYHGLAEAEIQRDQRDGQLKLVEINARSTTEARLTAKCGMNMEYIAYKDVLGLPMDPIGPPKPDVLWIEILRDIQSVFSREGYLAGKKITLTQWLRSLKSEREYAFWAIDDPLPFLVLVLRFIRTYLLKKETLHLFHKIFRSRR